MRLAHLSDDQINDALNEHGTQRAAASALNVTRSALQEAIKQRGIIPGGIVVPLQPHRDTMPRLTRESLHRALEPPNNCKVKAFLDLLDRDTREVVEEGLEYSNSDFAAAALRRWLKSEGYDETVIPGEDAIKAHRAGRKPCRCR